MKWLLTVACAALLGRPLGAVPPPATSLSGIQDVIFLTDARPVLIRLHVEIDGRPFEEIWLDQLRRVFHYLDTDGDGVLTKSEGERAPNASQMASYMQSGLFGGVQGQPFVSFRELDVAPADGLVTLKEFIAYYRRFGIGPLQSVTQRGATRSEAITRDLMKILDANKDGKLSRAELARAPAVLRRLDIDDDDMISRDEISSPSSAVAVNLQPPGTTMSAVNVAPPFYVVDRGKSQTDLPQRLLGKYDKDKNGRLSRSEIGLEPAAFDRLDTNHDGQLDARELNRLADAPGDFELVVRVGETGDRPPGAELLCQRLTAPGVRAERSDNGTLVLTIGDGQVAVQAFTDSFLEQSKLQSVFGRQFIFQQFQLAGASKKGYVEPRKLKDERFRFVRNLFMLADRDGDGKVTESELSAYIDVHETAQFSSTGLEILSSDRGLFEILDANRDGRLAQRELLTAWSRLAPWARWWAHAVSPSDLPQQFRLTLGRGSAFRFQNSANLASTTRGTRGPLWFRKMDTNGDGDVSAREFLGRSEDFQKIDTNHDGLIDAAEAAAADFWLRQAKTALTPARSR